MFLFLETRLREHTKLLIVIVYGYWIYWSFYKKFFLLLFVFFTFYSLYYFYNEKINNKN